MTSAKMPVSSMIRKISAPIAPAGFSRTRRTKNSTTGPLRLAGLGVASPVNDAELIRFPTQS
jgi:hypothetical protein